VLRITHCTAHGTPFDLTRAAYHLGNRHVPIELKPDHLKIEPDHVLADMLRSMHLIVVAVDEAFEPEGGAYGSHEHSHGGGHSHDHGPSHSTGPKPLVLAPELLDDHDHSHGHDHSHHGHSH
jgi:urease accessory protein